MDFRPLAIDDRTLFEQHLAGREYRLGTFNFDNLFLWRNWDPYLWAEVGSTLVVRSDYFSTPAYLPPLSPDDGAVIAATELLMEEAAAAGRPFYLCEVSEEMLALYQRTWPNRFRVRELRGGANYIYEQQALAFLPGHRFHAKRNHIRQFERACPGFELQPLDASNLAACRELELTWYANHPRSHEAEIEHQGVLDALSYLDQLASRGAVLMWQGRAVAFTLGGRLNSDTAMIHIEKADPDIPGAFQAINCFYAREYCGWASYINRAEDMNDPGLRRAKESYHPCRLEKKYLLEAAE